MQLVLVMFRNDGDRRSFSLTRSTTIIGRKDDCDLRVPSEKVSRKHCRIVKDGDSVRLEDLGSSNGTYHNGHRINASEVLTAGDSIEIGPVVFVLQVDGVPADDELSPLMDRAPKLEDELKQHPSIPAAATEEAEIAGLEELDHMAPAEFESSADDMFADENISLDAESESIRLEEPAATLTNEQDAPGLMELHEDNEHGSDNGSIALSEPDSEHEPISLADFSDEPAAPDLHSHGNSHDEPAGDHLLSEDELMLDLKPIDDSHNGH